MSVSGGAPFWIEAIVRPCMQWVRVVTQGAATLIIMLLFRPKRICGEYAPRRVPLEIVFNPLDVPASVELFASHKGLDSCRISDAKDIPNAST
jgi:hypothetical protein